MSTVFLYVVGVLVFLLAIFASIALHELGHLYYAKKFGCRVSQYMIGFGPTIASWRRGETEYGVKLVPLGGYVKIIGMFPPETKAQSDIADGIAPADETPDVEVSDEVAAAAKRASADAPVTLRKSNTGLFAQMVSQSRAAEFELVKPEDSERLFYKLDPGRKILVMLAGPGVNITLAFLCFLGVYGLYGVHTLQPTGNTVVGQVTDCIIPDSEDRTACAADDPLSPAREAGLQPGDQIIMMNGEDLSGWDDLSSRIHDNGDKKIELTVVRHGERVELDATHTVSRQRELTTDDGDSVVTDVGYLGVEPEYTEEVTHHGPVYTMQQMGEMTANAVTSVAELPGRVWNVAMAVMGVGERADDSPMSVIGGSRIAGEITSSTAEGIDLAGKITLLGMITGSFNLFIGIFNLIPLMPLDGGHIAGAGWEAIRRFFAKLFRRRDPGYVNVAAQLPLAYGLGFIILTMGMVLMIGDVVVPLSIGL